MAFYIPDSVKSLSFLQESGSTPAASPYKGGEWRREGPGSLAHVVIGEYGRRGGGTVIDRSM